MTILCAALIFLFTSAGVGTAWGQGGKPTSLAELARYAGADRQQILLEGAKKEGKLVWYTSLTHYQEIAKVFEAKYPGVKIEGYRASSSQLIKRTLTEAKTGRLVADAFETTPPALMLFRDEGLLLPYTSPSAASFPETSKEDAGTGLVHWVTDRESFIGVGYNKNLVAEKDVPRNFEDLLKPQWKGKLAMAGSTTGVRVIGAMLKAKGAEFVKKLKDQDVKLHMISGGALNGLVVSGEVAVSPTIFRNHVLEAVEKGASVGQAGQYEYLGDLPLIVLATSGPSASLGDLGQKLDDLWIELQQELLLLSENSEFRSYEIGHYPQLQSPELVIEAIQDVLGRCEATSPLP